jgi:hypothetical protein
MRTISDKGKYLGDFSAVEFVGKLKAIYEKNTALQASYITCILLISIVQPTAFVFLLVLFDFYPSSQ